MCVYILFSYANDNNYIKEIPEMERGDALEASLMLAYSRLFWNLLLIIFLSETSSLLPESHRFFGFDTIIYFVFPDINIRY